MALLWAGSAGGFWERRGAVAVSVLLLIGQVALWILLVLLAALLLVMLLLLFVPVRFQFGLASDLSAADWEDDITGSARWQFGLRWGGFLLAGRLAGENLHLTRSDFSIFGVRPGKSGSEKNRKKEKAGKAKPEKPETRKRRSKRPQGIDLALLRAIVSEVLRFIKRLMKSLSLRIRGELTYGFSDPALTGWIEAFRWSLGVPIPIALQAEFQRPCLVGSVQGDGRLYGYQLVAAFMRALRNPTIREWIGEQIRWRPVRFLVTRVILRGG